MLLGGCFRLARSREILQGRSLRAVQNHPWVVFPGLFVIPQLDGFDYATFAGETNDAILSFWPDPLLNRQLLRRAISEIDNDAVEEYRVATYSKLNGVKDAIAAC